MFKDLGPGDGLVVGAGGLGSGGGGVGGVTPGDPSRGLGKGSLGPVAWHDSSRRRGLLTPSVNNLHIALGRPDLCGCVLAEDSFKGAPMIATEVGEDGTPAWRDMIEEDFFRIQCRLEAAPVRMSTIPRTTLRDAVWNVLSSNSIDSAKTWLEGLKWDGVERVETFFSRYAHAADNPHNRAAARYLWSGLAGRVLQPGAKADVMVVLKGPQGCRKSTLVAAIAPKPAQFTTIGFHEKDDEVGRKLKGRLIVEVEELKGLASRDGEHIKSLLSRTEDTWIPKYKEMARTFLRRNMLVGTTNDDEFLEDHTGNRRYTVIEVGVVGGVKTKILIDDVIRDRDQLWAEAAALFSVDGVDWEVEALAAEENKNYVVSDTWEDAFQSWLKEPETSFGPAPASLPYLRMVDILSGIGVGRMRGGVVAQTRADLNRMAKVLRRLGYERAVRRLEGRNVKVWVLKSDG